MALKLDGEARFTEVLFAFSELSQAELQELLFAVLGHHKLIARRTNCTKHGNVQIIVEPEPTDEQG